MNKKEYEEALADDIAGYVHDPLGYVLYAYPWGEGELTGYGSDKPRKWQHAVLTDIGNHLQNPETRFKPLCLAVASGHGIGKSALIAMIDQWARSTMVDTRVTITANTETQLRTKTWPEITKWCNMAINSHWFVPTATAVICSDKKHEKSWRTDMIPWSIHKPEAFAGLHNKGKRIVVIFDEGSAIEDIIYEVTEGALTDENTEIIFIVFGNPTRNIGRFRECFRKFRHRWNTRQIDSRDVEGTNKNKINEWIEDYGEDSDFSRIRVRGIFPRASTNQFIPRDLIDKCLKFEAIEYEWHAKVFGIDLARSGECQNVICKRQGQKVFPLVKWRERDTMKSVNKIVEQYELENPDALFIDGGGLGGPIIDRLRQLLPKEKIFEVNFGWRKENMRKPERYFNKRAEMYGLAKEAMEGNVDLPNDQELINDLEAIEYGFNDKQLIQLEDKDKMEVSPDSSDSFVLTYAQPVLREKRKKKHRPAKRGGWRG